jgi:hypothetical protein
MQAKIINFKNVITVFDRLYASTELFLQLIEKKQQIHIPTQNKRLQKKKENT